MKLPKHLDFLTSVAFWVMVVNAFVLYMQQKGWIGDAELILVTAIAVPFVTINQGRKAAKDIGGVSPAVTEIEDQV